MESVSWTSAVRTALAALLVCGLTACGDSSELNSRLDEEGDSVPIPELTPAEKAELAGFHEPVLSASQEARVLSNYDHLDPQNLVPEALLKKAVVYYDTNKAGLRNPGVLTVVDFSSRSSRARMFMIDMASGAVTPMYMAHGSGSDPDNDGLATSFSNVSGSKKSSLGYYRTAETYYGKHGLSLRLDGLSSTNSNVRARAIVIHSASYVRDAAVKQGRSAGCLAVPDAYRSAVVNRLKEGSLIYAGLSN